MKIVSVIGARPQFVKAGPLSAKLRRSHREVIIHTGQHYDYEMSEVFLKELSIPKPDHHLGVGSGMHGAQTGLMLARIEEVLQEEQPEVVIVYGDTNSTLAGALAAAKLHIPVAHVEAGLRSFNRDMPEEINRVLVDHLSTHLFATSVGAVRNLAAEGITSSVHEVGDIMYDAVLLYSVEAESRSDVLERLGLEPKGYYVATVHRAENTDAPQRLRDIFDGLGLLDKPVVVPLHPRTSASLSRHRIDGVGARVRLIKPVGYMDMLLLMKHSACVITDSGGAQKEAGYLGVPCVTLRDETEWVETVEAGWNALAGTSPQRILESVARMAVPRLDPPPRLYGSGNTAERICDLLANFAP
jgi:UDP-GlcNAc3NAcA epimerase